MMVIALGADHAGFRLKEHLKIWLVEHGHSVLDVGTHDETSVDYPDFATLVGEAVLGRRADRGVLVCGAGIGMAIAANKIPGIRAAACIEPYSARLSREHNDTNVLTLGARIVAPAAAAHILETWLDAAFAGGRHQRRLDKLAAVETHHAASDDGPGQGDGDLAGVGERAGAAPR
jgi:ribose 5-phosphate isomerase B